jgi:hypothetical protein
VSITRTALLDDDSTGHTGTVWNDAWLQTFFDTLDARWSVKTITLTGAQNDLVTDDADLLILNNASPLVLTGLAAPSPAKPGKRLTLVSVNALVTIANDHANSAALNRVLNFATSGLTPLSLGSATYVYDPAGRWRLVEHEQGYAITPTFAAGDYTASGAMTWTVAAGDVSRLSYYLKGRQLLVRFALDTTSVGGTPSTDLYIANGAWGGFTAALQSNNALAVCTDNGVVDAGASIYSVPSGVVLRMLRGAFANWTASTNNTGVNGQIWVDVN